MIPGTWNAPLSASRRKTINGRGRRETRFRGARRPWPKRAPQFGHDRARGGCRIEGVPAGRTDRSRIVASQDDDKSGRMNGRNGPRAEQSLHGTRQPSKAHLTVDLPTSFLSMIGANSTEKRRVSREQGGCGHAPSTSASDRSGQNRAGNPIPQLLETVRPQAIRSPAGSVVDGVRRTEDDQLMEPNDDDLDPILVATGRLGQASGGRAGEGRSWDCEGCLTSRGQSPACLRPWASP